MAAANKAYTDVPRPQNDKYLFAKMSTVFSFSISGTAKCLHRVLYCMYLCAVSDSAPSSPVQASPRTT